MKKLRPILLFLFLFQFSFSQVPKDLSSSELYQAIQKLNFLGSVLYVGAHPDDENTKMISYFSNKIHAQTAYLSLTRGDGGQNLLGSEIREQLGVIRTEELLAARKIDGGKQFFTRANDFGFSKNPEETFKIWDKQKVLSDVVWVMREFQPDVIIDRFDHRTEGNTHGHHTASARLSVQAFDLAGDDAQFSKQLVYYSAWKPKRLFFNTSYWFYGSKEKFKKADKSHMLAIDVGNYYPLKGLSNTEIASMSRSEHKSQGFGNTASRGKDIEYLEFIKGDFPEKNTDVFAGINTTWTRVEGGEKIGKILKEVQENYDFENPSASIPQLVKAYKLIINIENKHWRKLKTKEIKKVIAACAGLYLEPTTKTNFAVRGEKISVNLEATNRSKTSISFTKIQFSEDKKAIDIQKKLPFNESFQISETLQIPSDANYSTPYWLQQKNTVGMYKVKNRELIGSPQSPAALTAIFTLKIEGEEIPFTKAVVFKSNDPIKGEVYKPFHVVPKISVSTQDKTLIFPTTQSKKIKVHVKAFGTDLSGKLRLKHPKNWQVVPASRTLHFQDKNEKQTVLFTVTPPKTNEEASLVPEFTTEGQSFKKALHLIDYSHIPQQTVLLPAQTKGIKLKIQKKGKNIAYIEGAGDEVPESLRTIGYHVDVFPAKDISQQKLQNYDAVVIGIRAYNTDKVLKFKQKILFDFVKNGGNMVVQYNKSQDLKVKNIAPFPLHLSHDRVTDEFSKVHFLAPKHPVLNSPNKISKEDFEGWVQERGLYFPDQWGEEFTPILGMKDSDESEKKGSLLVAKYGKGYYVYTGLSFFREFPAGVPGAFRLFANLLSLGK